jgi:DNA polymerase III subunit delta'
MTDTTINISPSDFAGEVLVGQAKARDTIARALGSNRLNHAYLFAGPEGTGKKVAALAMAEAINGISNLSNLGSSAWSRKSNWLNHPDIHLFIPIPSTVSFQDVQQRITILAEDPYSIVDFGHMPELNSQERSKNRKAFYPLAYYEKEIRPAAYLSPNEGKRTVIIITQIETMRKEVTNAFLKLLEEPPEEVMFILTTDQPDALLPTIISRCQVVPFTPVSPGDIEANLVKQHNFDAGNARYLSRACGGNYAMTRFYDLDGLKAQREGIVTFLRAAYAVDAMKIVDTAETWNKGMNNDATVDMLNQMEILLRDILLWRHTGHAESIINVDQIDVIQKFSDGLTKAQIPQMINEIADVKRHMVFNVNSKLLFIVLALRFARLMRGMDVIVDDQHSWKHFPQLVD